MHKNIVAESLLTRNKFIVVQEFVELSYICYIYANIKLLTVLSLPSIAGQPALDNH